MTELAPGSVTTADIYRELIGMRADVVKALTRVEVLDVRNIDMAHQLGDHEARVRVLEAFKWKLTGIALAVSGVAGAAGGLLAAHVH